MKRSQKREPVFLTFRDKRLAEKIVNAKINQPRRDTTHTKAVNA
jgi:hypothetical protein